MFKNSRPIRELNLYHVTPFIQSRATNVLHTFARSQHFSHNLSRILKEKTIYQRLWRLKLSELDAVLKSVSSLEEEAGADPMLSPAYNPDCDDIYSLGSPSGSYTSSTDTGYMEDLDTEQSNSPQLFPELETSISFADLLEDDERHPADEDLLNYLTVSPQKIDKSDTKTNSEETDKIDKDLLGFICDTTGVVSERDHEAKLKKTVTKVTIMPKKSEKTSLLGVTTKPTSSNTRVVQVVQASPITVTPANVSDMLDRNRHNAEMAKLNRQKKKAYVQGLESEAEALRKENKALVLKSNRLSEDNSSLQEEVAYLKNVLANQSVLADILKNMDNVKGVNLTTSFTAKRSADLDHDYRKPAKRARTVAPSSGGICLHVDKDNVSLEFCPKCAQMACGK